MHRPSLAFALTLLIAPFEILAPISSHAAIYGEDQRVEIHEAADPRVADWARAVAMIYDPESAISQDEPQPTSLKSGGILFPATRTPSKSDRRRFAEQPRIEHACTAFLIGPRLMATAGHCFHAGDFCAKGTAIRILFDYALPAGPAPSSIEVPRESIFKCKREIAKSIVESATAPNDFAVFELDREAKGRTPFRLSETAIGDMTGRKVAAIGFPRGFFMKYTDQAQVLGPESPLSARTNLDTFSGNSGSPVIDVASGEVLGILISGAFDEGWGTDPATGKSTMIDARYPEIPGPRDIQPITREPLRGEQIFGSPGVRAVLNGLTPGLVP